jgi:predicted deacylase
VFFHQIVAQADVGIDLHTAAVHRDNLPQIRADLDNPILEPLARAFGAPVLLHSGLLDGSLRKAAAEQGIPVMVYEAGEALRFDELSIRIGVRGVTNVLRRLGMLPAHKKEPKPATVLRSTTWVRAEQSGILRAAVRLGAGVQKGDVLGVISDPFGETEAQVVTPVSGVVIGRMNMPLVYGGEALFHIGRTQKASRVEGHLEALQATISDPLPELPEEPPIV